MTPYPIKIAFGGMRASGVRDVLIHLRAIGIRVRQPSKARPRSQESTTGAAFFVRSHWVTRVANPGTQPDHKIPGVRSATIVPKCIGRKYSGRP